MKYTPTVLHWQTVSSLYYRRVCDNVRSESDANCFWSWRSIEQLMNRHPGYFTICPKCEEIHAQCNTDHLDKLTKE